MISKRIQFPAVFLFSGALFAILWAVYFSLRTIFLPYQIEYREGAAQVMTEILLKGENPFGFSNQPLAMNNYGIGYNMVVYPFAVLFGNTLVVHRAVAFLFIGLSAMVGFAAVYKKTRSNSLALACAAFVMIGLIGHGGIGAFPSSLGTFLFLLALLSPLFRSFDRPGLALSFLFSLMAFYTKPYFILSFGIVSSYLFLFVSKRKGLLYGLLFLAACMLSLLAASRLLPLYYINIFVGNVSNANMIVDHLLDQLRVLFQSLYPVLLIMIVILSLQIFENRTRANDSDSFLDMSTWDSPFINRSFNFMFYSFLCSLLAFVFILGPHKGNYLNFAFQLLLPPFFCWLFGEFIYWPKLRLLFIFAALFNLFTWEYGLLNPGMLKQRDSKEWVRVYEYLQASSLTLNSPVMVSGILALGQMPTDSGQTAYYYEVKPFSRNLLNRIDYADFHENGFLYTKSIDRKIKTQKFDLVVTKKGGGGFYHFKLLPDYYYQVDEITVDMPQTGQVWTLILWKPLIK